MNTFPVYHNTISILLLPLSVHRLTVPGERRLLLIFCQSNIGIVSNELISLYQKSLPLSPVNPVTQPVPVTEMEIAPSDASSDVLPSLSPVMTLVWRTAVQGFCCERRTLNEIL